MTKIGILGSGMVGQSLAMGFLKLNYEIKIGTRETGKLKDWLKQAGKNASAGSFEDAAKFGGIIILCTKWEGAENAINLAGKKNFSGKILIDVTNPLLFEKENEAPKFALGYPESAGLKIQQLLPEAKVVKAFNIVTANYMCNPNLKEGKPDMFIVGNDKKAKDEVKKILENFGWAVSDLGEIEQAYLLEALAMIWIRYGFLNNHWTHAWKLLKK